MGSDDAKRLILARRARFVAAALGGLSAAVGCGETLEPNPQPCLDVAVDGGPDASAGDAEPQVCLSPIAPDSGTDAGNDGAPQPCLTPAK